MKLYSICCLYVINNICVKNGNSPRLTNFDQFVSNAIMLKCYALFLLNHFLIYNIFQNNFAILLPVLFIFSDS